MKTVLDFLSEHWLVLSPILLELILRFIPTEKNYSLARVVKLAFELLDHTLPNRRKGGGKHTIVKAILFFALVGICGNSYAQLNTVTRQVRFQTGVQAAADTAATNANRGRIWYDFNTHRFRANESGVNTFLIGGTGGDFWALDGVSTFLGNVDIDGDGNSLTYSNMSAFQYFSPSLTTLVTFDDTKINFSSPSIESLTKHFFNPSATRASINLGILAGDPSALVNGDIWYSSATGTFRGRAGGSTFSFGAGTTPGGADTQIQFNDGGIFNAESGLRWIKSPSNTLIIANSGGTFSTSLNGATIQGSSTIALASTGNNTVTINAGTGNITHTGKALFNPTATEAGLNFGTLAGDPSSPDDGDNWYNSSAGYYRFRKTGSTYIDLGTTGLTTDRIPIASATDNLIDDPDLSFTGGNTLNATNVTTTGATTTGTLSITQGAIISGTYTPTVTGTLNVAATTAYTSQYMRVGNVVTVSGRVDIDPTATGLTRFTISCPVTTNFSGGGTEGCGGTFAQVDTGLVGCINATFAASTVNCSYSAVSASNNAFLMYHFTYIIQ